MCFGDPIPIGGTQYLFHAFLELLNLSLDAGRKSLAKLVEVLLQVWDLFSPCILVNLAKMSTKNANCRQDDPYNSLYMVKFQYPQKFLHHISINFQATDVELTVSGDDANGCFHTLGRSFVAGTHPLQNAAVLTIAWAGNECFKQKIGVWRSWGGGKPFNAR